MKYIIKDKVFDIMNKGSGLPRWEAEELLAIKGGKYQYDELLAMVGDFDSDFDALVTQSSLPDRPDEDRIEKLFFTLLEISNEISE